MGTVSYRGYEGSTVGLLFAHPDRIDIVEGEPLSSRSGRFLKHSLHDAGIKPFDCYIDYIMPSYPGSKGFNSIEAQDEIAEYESKLKAHIKKHKNLKVILSFGPEILPYIGIHGTLNKTRGFVFDQFPVPIIPTYNPAYLFRGNGAEDITFLNDLQKASDIAKNGFQRPPEDFILGPSEADVDAFLSPLRDGKTRLFVDIEAVGSLNERDRNSITMIGILNEKTRKTMVIPLITQGGIRYWSQSQEERVRSRIQEVFQVSPCVFHNAEYDAKHLNYQGFGPVRIGGDTMLLHHALHPELPHSLDYVTSVYGNIPYWKSTLKKARNQLDIPNEDLWRYNARDCLATFQVESELVKECQEQGTYPVYEDISMKMIPIVLEMNDNGLPVDATRLVAWRAKLEKRNEFILDTMSDLWPIDEEFNWDSRQHVGWLFYGEKPDSYTKKQSEYAEYFLQGSKKKKNTKKFQALEAYIGVFERTKPFNKLTGLNIKRSKTGPSTDDEMRGRIREGIIKRYEAVLNFKTEKEAYKVELEELSAMRKVIDNLMEYATNGKLLSTYTKLHIEPDGCVHPGYKVSGTATGRLSSYSPNGQNLPPDAKKIFVAPKGWKFFQFDFTNLELVVLAYVALIPYLIDVFSRGLNVHDENTKRFLGIDPDSPVWGDWRRVMKMYVFGRNYGGGLKGMYRRMLTAIPGLQMTFKQFCELDKKYFELMPEYGVWYDETVSELRTTRMLTNAFGRIRIFLGEIESVVREGLNFPIQGTAADIMSFGLIDFFEIYKRAKAQGLKMRLSLSVHDSAVVLAPEPEGLVVLKMFKKSMCQPRQIGENEVSFTGNVTIMDDLKGKKKIKNDPNPEERKIDEWIAEYERRKEQAKSHAR